LPRETPPRGAKRRANKDLALARLKPCQEESAEVRAHEEQDERDGSKK
jgi:hypothetical protein